MAEADIGAYAHSLIEDVRAQAEIEGCNLHEAFTQLMLDQLAADGHTEDAVAVHLKDHGMEISGYGAASDDRSLDLFLTYYSPRADEDHKIGRAEVEAAFRRLENFLSRCVSGTLTRRDRSSEVAGMCAAVTEKFGRVEVVRLVLITNARSVVRDSIAPMLFEGRHVTRELWDLRRLANWSTSGNKAEPIVAEFPGGLPCLATPRTDEDYSVLLAIVPARGLADLYSTHGARLLELNVRSFLQVRGAVNRGILDTLRNNPERFLAYNNGIAATASRVDFEEDPSGHRVIRRIHNLQIVNGGQTTATIHHAHRNKVDVGAAHVQMKLTVVSPDRLDDIVPQISAYSNTQNRVTASDLKANSAFHVDVERIMRTLWAPPSPTHPHDTHWFYERARGQYANALTREGTPARQKVFKAVHPPAQKFTKSDLAKFEHSWAMQPHLVSLGAEKNFTLFSQQIDEQPPAVDKQYCRHLVAKAILFRKADKIVARQNFGGYKANIVTYTVAKLAHATRGRIDLDRIWRSQDLTLALQDAITDLSHLVQKVITSPPEGRTNVGEWTKRPECWAAVRDLDWVVPAPLDAELLDVDTYDDDTKLIRGTSPTDWTDLAAWGIDTGFLDAEQRRSAMEIAQALDQGWDPAGKHLRSGLEAMRRARRDGFRPVSGL
ncbi:AIPR family protein [Micromonospora sp. C28SCA-DRY-2]|uniref:AIPR family protein n=1 Tax=Micromonospora sp. C28SCA-DRY-2 TaxID=3059522 RepID=UPI0026770769|nr:AIPR family protein [Micromonospora sp. C28SCA-DRY-2]MDO3704072.1 AIPR family protein [Micromonospora sp. C28SCA-DRY-2]